MQNLHIDPQRLWDQLMETAQFGATAKGGIRRLTLTDDDRQVRDWFKAQCEALGCTVTVDEVGNMFARRPGRNDDAAADRDGLASRHAADRRQVRRRARGAGRARGAAHPGHRSATRPTRRSRWSTGPTRRARASRRRCCASGVFAGVFTPELRLRARGPRGQAVRRRAGADRLPRRGAGGRRTGSAPCSSCTSSRGRSSRTRRRMIGVVQGVQGMRWYEVTVTGQDAHTGATPMHLRKNALLGRRADDRADRRDRAGARAGGGRHGRAGRGQAQLAQRGPGRGLLHGRLPPPGGGRARRRWSASSAPRLPEVMAPLKLAYDEKRIWDSPAVQVRSRADRLRAHGRRAGGLPDARHGLRRRPRRRLYRARGADDDDLRPVRSAASATTRARARRFEECAAGRAGAAQRGAGVRPTVGG